MSALLLLLLSLLLLMMMMLLLFLLNSVRGHRTRPIWSGKRNNP